MGLFYRSRDFKLIETINEELIGEFINTEVDVYKYNLYESEVNLYGEARSKVYYQGLRVAALIEQEDQTYDTAEYPGAELNQVATFNFLRKTIKNAGLFMEIGDIISWNDSYWEVNGVVENQLVYGQTENTLTITVTTHMSRKTKLQLERVRVGDASKNNSMRHIFTICNRQSSTWCTKTTIKTNKSWFYKDKKRRQSW